MNRSDQTRTTCRIEENHCAPFKCGWLDRVDWIVCPVNVRQYFKHHQDSHLIESSDIDEATEVAYQACRNKFNLNDDQIEDCLKYGF